MHKKYSVEGDTVRLIYFVGGIRITMDNN